MSVSRISTEPKKTTPENVKAPDIAFHPRSCHAIGTGEQIQSPHHRRWWDLCCDEPAAFPGQFRPGPGFADRHHGRPCQVSWSALEQHSAVLWCDALHQSRVENSFFLQGARWTKESRSVYRSFCSSARILAIISSRCTCDQAVC